MRRTTVRHQNGALRCDACGCVVPLLGLRKHVADGRGRRESEVSDLEDEIIHDGLGGVDDLA